jgi:hypothetical protein
MIGKNSAANALLADADTSKNNEFPSLVSLVIDFIGKNHAIFSLSTIRSLPVACKERISDEILSLILQNTLDKAVNRSYVDLSIQASGRLSPILRVLIFLHPFVIAALTSLLYSRFAMSVSDSLGLKIFSLISIAIGSMACYSCIYLLAEACLNRCLYWQNKQILPFTKIESETFSLMREIITAQIVISIAAKKIISPEIRSLNRTLLLHSDNRNFEEIEWTPLFSAVLKQFRDLLPHLDKNALLGIVPQDKTNLTAVIVDAGAPRPELSEERKMSSRGFIAPTSRNGIAITDNPHLMFGNLQRFETLDESDKNPLLVFQPKYGAI